MHSSVGVWDNGRIFEVDWIFLAFWTTYILQKSASKDLHKHNNFPFANIVQKMIMMLKIANTLRALTQLEKIYHAAPVRQQ